MILPIEGESLQLDIFVFLSILSCNKHTLCQQIVQNCSKKHLNDICRKKTPTVAHKSQYLMYGWKKRYEMLHS